MKRFSPPSAEGTKSKSSQLGRIDLGRHGSCDIARWHSASAWSRRAESITCYTSIHSADTEPLPCLLFFSDGQNLTQSPLEVVRNLIARCRIVSGRDVRVYTCTHDTYTRVHTCTFIARAVWWNTRARIWCAHRVNKFRHENSADAEIARHAIRWMPSKWKTSHFSIPHLYY